MTVYYNEIDPYAAQWLRNLMAAGHIAEGEVDERSITEVQHEDLSGFDQCHFFAGIGVWSHALRRAGWPDDRPVWTGSCPCQPFSAAGQQRGFDDERHLWPVWYRLIDQCRPPVVLGEQVASALDWLDLVSADMEASDYAFGASDLCAAGFGGAHIRQRLYFAGVADAVHARRAERRPVARNGSVASGSSYGRLADADGCGQQGQSRCGSAQSVGVAERGGVSGVADTESARRSVRHAEDERATDAPRDAFADASNSATDRQQRFAVERTHAPLLGRDAADWLYCRDGKWRPVEPGTFPLADAAPARVGRLRAYGNGLDAETATQFIAAVMDCAP